MHINGFPALVGAIWKSARSSKTGHFKLIANDVTRLEMVLVSFFEQLTKNDGEGVKKSYLESIFSHIKCAIKEKSGGTIDISSNGAFPTLCLVIKGLYRELKNEGRGDVKHYPEIPAAIQKPILDSFGFLSEAFKARQEQNWLCWEVNIARLPLEYQNCPHKYLQKAVMYIVIMAEIRRGREGVDKLQKHMYELKEDDGIMYYIRTVGEGTKNHQNDNENLEKSGIIVFGTEENKFDAGFLFHAYLKALSDDSMLAALTSKAAKTSPMQC